MTIRFFAAVLAAALLLLPFQAKAVDVSRSAYLSNQHYNAIISDSEFIAIDSMSVAEIQSFLEGKNSYLAQFSENGRSAAQIIYDAAHGHNAASGSLRGIDINTTTGTVSPKALLVTLQKEQSLVTLTAADRETNTATYQNRLDRAMGYACPDSGGCDDKYKGFTNQVEWAAWQLRFNFEAAGQSQSWWNQYYPASTSACGRQFYVGKVCSLTWTFDEDGDGRNESHSYSVTFSNKVTAALYRYTPHVGNGNYNFWRLMNSWFTPGEANIIVAPTTSNDTTEISSSTYSEKFKVEGSKARLDNVFYNGKQVGWPGSDTWSVELALEVGNKDYIIEYRNGDGQVIATKKVTVDRRSVGDINGDTKIDLLDLSILGESFGVGVSDSDWRNLNPDVDNEVNILDLSLFAERWTG